jgi:quercetin dioxygenase-like cupin family protein
MPGKFMFQNEIEPNVLDWGRLSWLCHPPSTSAKQTTVIAGTIFPGTGHNFHLHPNQEEVLYVVSGSIEQWIEREMKMLGPGDCAFLPPGVVHASFNAGSDEAKVLAIFGPSVGDSGIEMVDVAGDAPWNGLRAKAA